MKRFSLLRALSVVSLVLSLGAVAQAQTPAPTPEAANDIFTDKGELGIEFARNDAHAQIVASEGSTTRLRYKSPREETRFYDGYFKARSNTTKLAVLSDDGSSVWIDGVPVLERARQNQGFENFDRAFTELSPTFAANRIYHIKLEYTNTIHQNESDRDGITLFAYDGGGEFVAPPTSTSTALSFDLLRAAGAATSTQAANYSSFGSGAIGGQVYGALYLTVAQGQRVASRTALVRLHEEADEANRVVHPASEDRIDVPVSFIERGGWQKYYDPEGERELGWWDAPEAPSAATSSAGPVRYRFLLGWNTARETPGTHREGERSVAGKLWGHNGAHRMSLLAVDNDGAAQVAVVSDASGAARASRPADKQAVVGNLVITEAKARNGTVENRDYFKFDAESTNAALAHPQLSFTIQDNGDRHRYQWYLWVKPTRGEPNSRTISGIMASHGTQTITINQAGTGYTQDARLTERGTYTFDLRVIEIQNNSTADIGEPPVELRSTKVNMSSHSFKYLSDDEADFKVVADYVISGDRGASEVKIYFVDPNMVDKVDGIEGPDSVGSHQDIDVYNILDTDPSGIYTGVFTAADNHHDTYRDHKVKIMSDINYKSATKVNYNIWYDRLTWSRLSGHVNVGVIDTSFKSIGITPNWRQMTSGATINTKAVGGWFPTFQTLSNPEQLIPGVKDNSNVIIMEYQGSAKGRKVDGVLGQTSHTGYLPHNNPGLVAINSTALQENYAGEGQGTGEPLADGFGVLEAPLSAGQL